MVRVVRRARVRVLWRSFLALRAPAYVVARLTIWLYAVYAVVQGVGICVGGPGRWSDASYARLLAVPGGPYVWGAVLTVLGLLLGWASWRQHWGWKLAALVGIVVWSMAFALGGLAALLTDPHAGTTIVPAYLLHAAVAASLIMIDESRYPDESLPSPPVPDDPAAER